MIGSFAAATARRLRFLAVGRSPLKGRPGSGGGRRTAVAVMWTVAMMVGAAPARAEEQPAILKSYGLDWIERVREEAWPQPKLERPVICLLDTGVAVTPDTPADDPMGPIVARLSVEDPVGGMPPGDGPPLGLPQGDSWTHLHGTRMAAIIAAPRNGVGTVGVFPQARIVSIRVTVGAETHIVPADIVKGVRRCHRWADQAKVRVGSVVLAESFYEQRAVDVEAWETAARTAAEDGALFVAAMGNTPNAASVGPLVVTALVSVGAANDDGVLCPGVPQEPGQILGPGCSVAAPAWHEGSSSATAAIGALTAAVATRTRPATADELRSAVEAVTVPNAQGYGRIAGEKAAAHFVGLVDAPLAIAPKPVEIQVERRGATHDQTGPALRLWKPKVKARWRRGRLEIERVSHKRTGILLVRAQGSSAVSRVRAARGTIRGIRRPRSVTVWAESEDSTTWRSLTARIRVKR